MKNLIGNRRRSRVSVKEALAVRADYVHGSTWKELRVKYKLSIATLNQILNGTHPCLQDEGESNG